MLTLTSWLVETENYATLSRGTQETVLAAVTGTSTDKSAADGDLRFSYGNSIKEEQVADFSKNTGKKDVALEKATKQLNSVMRATILQKLARMQQATKILSLARAERQEFMLSEILS